jgi:hypothetical protein
MFSLIHTFYFITIRTQSLFSITSIAKAKDAKKSERVKVDRFMNIRLLVGVAAVFQLGFVTAVQAQTCGCSNYCGSICMDGVVCPCLYDAPTCDSTSGGMLPVCHESCSPIVLDPFSKGFHFTDITHGVKFRVTDNGPLLQMSWPAASSRNGWLVLDRNGNGVIDDFTELFGNVTPQPPSSLPNGYLALGLFDKPQNGGNGNGVIDPGDSVFSHLRVWIDENHNGISEPNELHKLQEVGVFRIGLDYWRSDYVDANGNAFRYKAFIWDSTGEQHPDVTYDVFPVVEAIQANGKTVK